MFLGYEPNSYGEWREQPAYQTPPEPLGDVAASNWNFRVDDDEFPLDTTIVAAHLCRLEPAAPLRRSPKP